LIINIWANSSIKLLKEATSKEVEVKEGEEVSDLVEIEVALNKDLPHTLFPMAHSFINRKTALL